MMGPNGRDGVFYPSFEDRSMKLRDVISKLALMVTLYMLSNTAAWPLWG